MAYDASTHDPVPFLGKTNQGNVLERGLPVPLDRTSLFDSLADATVYARQGADARELSGTSYPGQVLTVLENNVATVYYIAPGSKYAQGDEIPEGKQVGDEIVSTRTLVRLGTKAEIEAASASAVMNWLDQNGHEI